MVKARIMSLLPLLLAGAGVAFVYFAPFPTKNEGGTFMISGFVTIGGLFSTFTTVALSFFLSNQGNWAKKMRKRGMFLELVGQMRYSLTCFLLLLIIAVLGFFFYDWAYYPYVLFFLFGYSAGHYLNIITLMIKAGVYGVTEDDKEKKASIS